MKQSAPMRARYARSLRDLYVELNERYWGGRLPQPLSYQKAIGDEIVPRDLPRFVILRRIGVRFSDGIMQSNWLRCPGARKGDCGGLFLNPRTYWPAEIRVLSTPLAPEDEREILIHEMVHCALFAAGFPKENHGPRFVAELERLVAEGESWATEKAAHYREHPGE